MCQECRSSLRSIGGGSNMWPRLKASEKGHVATTCTLCPQWTTTVPMPSQLSKLEALCSQPAHSTCQISSDLVHIYCAKVITYNSVQAALN